MRDGDCQRVGGVVGLGDLVQLQEDARHLLHLSLVRGAVSRHGLFDLVGRVLEDLQSRLLEGEQRHAARLSHRDGGRDVALEEQFLHGGSIGFVFFQQGTQAAVETLQPRGDGVRFRGEDHAEGDRVQPPVGFEAHQSVAGGGEAGVNSEREGHKKKF